MRQLLLLLTPFVPLVGQQPATKPPVNETPLVQKAVYAFLAKPNVAHTTGKISAVCLSLGTERPPSQGRQLPLKGYTDAPPSLVRMLSATLPIVGGTRCMADMAKAGAITDTSNKGKRTAMAIILGTATFGPAGKATMQAERAFATTSVIGFSCHLDKKGTAWVVTACDNAWFADR